MRSIALMSVVGLYVVLSTSAPGAETYVQGNDTGGIISWSCESEAAARAIAGEHCARFGKYARITGVHRKYGEHISFHCLWNPRIARFQLPPVGVRSYCGRAYKSVTIDK